MKKLAFIVAIIMVVSSLAGVVFALPQDIYVTVDGNRVNFPDAVPFIDANNRTLIPVRFVSEELGAKVEWNAERKEVNIEKESVKVKVRINDRNIVINGGTIKSMDTKAIIKEDRTFVPIRYVAEALGATVGWDGASRTVIISTKAAPVVTPTIAKATPTPPNEVAPSATPYDPARWVRVAENSGDTELSINISWDPNSEHYKAKCSYAEAAIAKKYNPEIAKKVIDIARKKTERMYQSYEEFMYNGKKVEVYVWGSSIGIKFWKAGVK